MATKAAPAMRVTDPLNMHFLVAAATAAVQSVPFLGRPSLHVFLSADFEIFSHAAASVFTAAVHASVPFLVAAAQALMATGSVMATALVVVLVSAFFSAA